MSAFAHTASGGAAGAGRIIGMTGAALVGLLGLAGCALAARDTVPEPGPLGRDDGPPEVLALEVVPVLEQERVIKVEQGVDCAESNLPGEEVPVQLAGSMILPDYADRATVFLAGWLLRYLNHDNHVRELQTSIDGIALVGDTLTWQASSKLSDNDFKDPYRWCYVFMVVAWNSGELALAVDHDQAGHVNTGKSNFFDTALLPLRSYLSDAAYVAPRPIAILPRGFTYAYEGDDHHLLQLGYHLHHAETFADPDANYFDLPTPALAAASAGAGFASWRTDAILKDNDARRNYRFSSTHSALFGSDLHVLEPAFAITPVEDMGDSTCIGEPSGLKTQTFEVRDLPFEHAVPVLSGWRLAYSCNNHHVRRIGVWLHDVSYEKAPGEPTGTLRYGISSILIDDSDNGSQEGYNVHVLGLEPTRRGPGGIAPVPENGEVLGDDVPSGGGPQ